VHRRLVCVVDDEGDGASVVRNDGGNASLVEVVAHVGAAGSVDKVLKLFDLVTDVSTK